jgi:hypothetical protein
MSGTSGLSRDKKRALKSLHWSYRYPRLYAVSRALGNSSERLGYAAFGIWERLRPGATDILVQREIERGLQPTMWFEDHLAHWDDDLVAGCAQHLETTPGVRAAVHVDREVIELNARLVPAWVLRRRARRWVHTYQLSHPSQLRY